eukprot:837076-Amphidinium_carterae.1
MPTEIRVTLVRLPLHGAWRFQHALMQLWFPKGSARPKGERKLHWQMQLCIKMVVGSRRTVLKATQVFAADKSLR